MSCEKWLWPPPKNQCLSLHHDQFFWVCPLLDWLKMLGNRKTHYLKWWFDADLPWYNIKNSPETNPTIYHSFQPARSAGLTNKNTTTMVDCYFKVESFHFFGWHERKKTHPSKNPDPSKMAIFEDLYTPAIQVQTLPLEGPRILRANIIPGWSFLWWFTLHFKKTDSKIPTRPPGKKNKQTHGT